MAYCEGGDINNKIKLTKGKFFTEHVIIDWFV